MMQGPIRRLSRDRVERREEMRLPSAWVRGEPPAGNSAGLSWLRSEERSATAHVDRGAPVLVMLASNEGGALQELVAHGDAGERVYAIVPPGWGKEPVERQLLKSPRVLMRRVPEVPVAGVHKSSGARLWFGGRTGGPAPWSLRLEATQAEAFRQVFLRLFWHEATEETWTGGSQLVWRVAGERPFDVPELPRAAPLRLLTPEARLERDTRNALVHLVSGAWPEATPRRLWLPPGGEHHDRLSRLVRDGAQVVWEDRNLPDLMVSGDTGELLLPGTRARLRILLTAEQVVDAVQLLEAPARWRFGRDLRLGDPDHARALFWLPGEKAPRGLEGEQGIELPEVSSETLRQVPDTSPVAWPTPQPLALAVRYRWKVVPPRLPGGTEEDALIGRWRQLDEDWVNRLRRIRDALQAAEGERGRIGKAFSRLVGAMLGFERTHGGLMKQVEELEAQRPSKAGPGGAPNLLSQLMDLEGRMERLKGDLEEAERKAREDEEREKQEAEWKARTEAAKAALPKKREALEEARTRRGETHKALQEAEAKLADASKEEKKDLKARKALLSDELNRQDKELQRLQDEIRQHESVAAETFAFKPRQEPRTRPPQGKGRFVPESNAARRPPVSPEEALPSVGELRTSRGQRYLVIERWEDLDIGEAEARRLNARLVTQEQI